MLVFYMFEKLIEYLLRNVKVDKKLLQESVDKADYNADGFISLGEFVSFVRDMIGKYKQL